MSVKDRSLLLLLLEEEEEEGILSRIVLIRFRKSLIKRISFDFNISFNIFMNINYDCNI